MGVVDGLGFGDAFVVSVVWSAVGVSSLVGSIDAASFVTVSCLLTVT